MIPKIGRRGTRVGGLLRYLFGPGRCAQHVNPRLVACWRDPGFVSSLEPPVGVDGRRDLRRLVDLLEQPVRAGRNPPALTVWHCSLRAAPEDPYLSDAQWANIGREVMAAVGLAPYGDSRAVRWVAVRHANDHIHLVATLVRQDGRTAWAWRDKVRAQAACRNIEQRYGLRRLMAADGTAACRPGMAEVAKARRLGQAVAARDVLRRRVRVAVAASGGEDEFAARLRDAGVLVEFRYSTTGAGKRTGYRVALPGFTAADGGPVWFGGGKLATDLTLPRLRARWVDLPGARSSTAGKVRVTRSGRTRALVEAAAVVRAATEEFRRDVYIDPAGLEAVAQAGSDLLTVAASTVEGRVGGPLSRAAEVFDRAVRSGRGRTAAATRRSCEIRELARLVYLMGRITGGDNTDAVLGLILNLAKLGDALAWLRQVQRRCYQAEAARKATAELRAAVTSGVRPVTAVVTAPTTPGSNMGGACHRRPGTHRPGVGGCPPERKQRPNR